MERIVCVQKGRKLEVEGTRADQEEDEDPTGFEATGAATMNGCMKVVWSIDLYLPGGRET